VNETSDNDMLSGDGGRSETDYAPDCVPRGTAALVRKNDTRAALAPERANGIKFEESGISCPSAPATPGRGQALPAQAPRLKEHRFAALLAVLADDLLTIVIHSGRPAKHLQQRLCNQIMGGMRLNRSSTERSSTQAAFIALEVPRAKYMTAQAAMR
jgi:hypothetical protein